MSSDRPRTIAARRAYIGGEFTAATLTITDDVVAAIGAFDEQADAVVPDDFVLLPGLVDSHVHLDEPGRTEWEGFETGTAAALAGGITTLVDMPLNSSPVTTTPDALAAKRAATAGKLAVDLGYWGGAVPENLGGLAALAQAGVAGFKCFLSPSGIDEFGHLTADQLEQALAEIVAFDGLLIVHAEDPAHLHAAEVASGGTRVAGGGTEGALGTRYADFLASRPASSESAAIRTVIDAARATGARVHIVHVSDAGALDEVRAAVAEGVRLSVETCPHYLTLRAEDVPDASPAFKCCPPIRDSANQDLLWQGILDGTIAAIVSDHSPATLELKQKGGGDFGLAWGGIAGVQTSFAAVWTEARRRGIALETLLPLVTTGPARIAGIPDAGIIAVGNPAHLTVFAPEESAVVVAADLEYRHKISPWEGRELHGVVSAVYVHGALAYRLGEGIRARRGRELLAPCSSSASRRDEEREPV